MPLNRGSVLPADLLPDFERCYVDSELVSLREDIATMEARIRQMFRQMAEDERNSAPWASVLGKTLEQMKGEIKRGSLTYQQAFLQVCEFMESQVKLNLLWAEIHTCTEARRRLIATESKRIRELGWTPEMVLSMLSEIADFVKPLLDHREMQIFLSQMANSKLFNNQQFKLLEKVNLSQRSLDEQLMALEVKARQAKKTAVETEEKEGVFAPCQ